MSMVRLIERKREGESLSPQEWRWLIDGYTAGRLPDYQVAALLMAVRFKGLDRSELSALTDAMLESGARLQFDERCPPRVDKHSTGGVGDKVSLILAPLVSCCGVAVPMMSGRGLGHTGGTLDKLESITGFRTDLSLAEAERQVERLGCVMIGQTPEIAPADGKLYALRDATATVESIPLIAASIMSKKLAEGLNGLVLDVKQGSGAFLPPVEQALELARTMIELGSDRGCPTVALVTAMDRPLGWACGNALEMGESIRALMGHGPEDLMEVVYAVGVEMLLLARTASSAAEARTRLESAIGSGRALEQLRRIVIAQHGDPRVIDDPGLLPRAPIIETVRAHRSGFVERVEPRAIGRAIVDLGGGRSRMDDVISPAVGFELPVKPGDRVEIGTPLAAIHASDQEGAARARLALEQAVRLVSERPTPPLPLITHRVTANGLTAVG